MFLSDFINPSAPTGFSHVSVISVTQHSDKKPLESYDKDSERVHGWRYNLLTKNEIT